MGPPLGGFCATDALRVLSRLYALPSGCSGEAMPVTSLFLSIDWFLVLSSFRPAIFSAGEQTMSSALSVQVDASAMSLIRWRIVCVPDEILCGSGSICVPTVFVFRFLHRVFRALRVPVRALSGSFTAPVSGCLSFLELTSTLSVWQHTSEVSVTEEAGLVPYSRRSNFRCRLCIFSFDAVSFASRSRIAATAVARAIAASSSAADRTRCRRCSSLAVRMRTRAVVCNLAVADSKALEVMTCA